MLWLITICAECVGFVVDRSNYQSSVEILASSNSDTAPLALISAANNSDNSVWKASVEDVDADNDFVYSVMLSSSQNSYLATLRMDVANVAVIILYVQCRERPGVWSAATAPVCNSSGSKM